MSGKPRFDDEVVLDAAMAVFRRHGFNASSLEDLTKATGLSRSSLYKRFRDKEGLYREVLSRYQDRILRRMESLEAETRRAQLETWLFAFVFDGMEPRPGCMLARACSEMGDLPEEGRMSALDGLTRQRELLRKILTAAVAGGELGPTADIEAMAWHFLGVLHALVNLPQAGATPAELRRMIAVAMDAWAK